MAKINSKAMKSITKIIEAGYNSEKEVLAMTMDDILSLNDIWDTSIPLC